MFGSHLPENVCLVCKVAEFAETSFHYNLIEVVGNSLTLTHRKLLSQLLLP